MLIELSEQDVDLIVLALKGFVDDNVLYADQISSRMTKEQVRSIERLNKQAELLILNLDTQESQQNKNNVVKTQEQHDMKEHKTVKHQSKRHSSKEKKC